MSMLLASLRVAAVTILVCVAGYAGVILGLARVVSPGTADGSLLTTADGKVVGSRMIAQPFTWSGYFWPRPSAADYNASAAAGSNLSPTSPALTERARAIVARYGATPANPVPVDLVTASGAGLDPHISERAARYQGPRIAAARGLDAGRLDELIASHAIRPGGPLTPDRIVNVLELNLALDSLAPSARR